MHHIRLLLLLLLPVVLSAQSKLFPVEIKGKWGYMNHEGKMLLPAIYDYAGDFTESHAVVALNRMPGIIDRTGKLVVDTGIYQYIGPVSEGLSAVTDFSRKKYYVDVTGRRVLQLPDSIYEARPFSNGRACVSASVQLHTRKFEMDIVTLVYRFGFINRTGDLVVPFRYDDADNFVRGRARVKSGQLFGMIDTTGAEVIAVKYSILGDLNSGLALFRNKEKFGFLDSAGQVIIPASYEFARDFSDGLAAVLVKDKFGFINTSGELIITPRFEAVKAFSEGKAAVRLEGKWGFVNTKGDWVLRNVFDNAGVFREGLCPVLVKRKWGFTDTTGRLAIPAEFDAAGAFHDGIADVVFRNLNLYVNSKGMVLPVLPK
jgi:hypothetical protein